MTAREEMSRFGFDRNQTPHPIFERLSVLRNTYRPSRKVEQEIEAIEREIERSMEDAEAEHQERMLRAHMEFWQGWLERDDNALNAI